MNISMGTPVNAACQDAWSQYKVTRMYIDGLAKTKHEYQADGLMCDAYFAGWKAATQASLDLQGYVDAFYELCLLLDVRAPQPIAPKEVWESQVRPRLRALRELVQPPYDRESIAQMLEFGPEVFIREAVAKQISLLRAYVKNVGHECVQHEDKRTLPEPQHLDAATDSFIAIARLSTFNLPPRHVILNALTGAIPHLGGSNVPQPQPSVPQSGGWIAADDVHRLVREIDVALNGEEGAAQRPALVDVTAQIKKAARDLGRPLLAEPAGLDAAVEADLRRVVEFTFERCTNAEAGQKCLGFIVRYGETLLKALPHLRGQGVPVAIVEAHGRCKKVRITGHVDVGDQLYRAAPKPAEGGEDQHG